MFQSSTTRLRAWLKRVDDVLEDVLGDPPAAAQPHPHRRPLRWERTRRAGSVSARPAHCLSPIRASGTGSSARRDRAGR
jgi:hypothetical protein